MSSSLLIVVLVVVWLFVLAPMVIRTRKPIRRTGDGLAQTRTLHAGGGRRLEPRRGRPGTSRLEELEPEDMELFGLPSGAGSTDAELVEADSWLERLAEDRARHLEELRGHRLREQAGRRGGAATLVVEERADEIDSVGVADSGDVVDAVGTVDSVDSVEDAAGQSHRAGIAALARPRQAAGGEGRSEGARPVGARSSRIEVYAGFRDASTERTADNAVDPAEVSAAVDAENTDASTYVVDGEVFERPAEQPEPTERERREAAHTARIAARAAARPHAPELDEADYDYVERRRGRGVYDPRADRRAAAERAVRRQRTALGLLAMTIVFSLAALLFTPHLWWGAAVGAGLLVAYLWYLRKQVRMEQNLRARRMERLRRARLGVESREDAELSVVPERLRRPGSVVLEIDDEDPVFDHLDSPRQLEGDDPQSARRGVPARDPREQRHGPARRAV